MNLLGAHVISLFLVSLVCKTSDLPKEASRITDNRGLKDHLPPSYIGPGEGRIEA